jgi:predicted RNA-binding protein with TRAM domain
MAENRDSLHSIFSAKVEEQDEKFVVEVPQNLIDPNELTEDNAYRVALLDSHSSNSPNQNKSRAVSSQEIEESSPPKPPVEEGEVRDLTIETIGEEGDGIAKVDRGYVVIVPDAEPGDNVTVKIGQTQENLAFASVINKA